MVREANNQIENVQYIQYKYNSIATLIRNRLSVFGDDTHWCMCLCVAIVQTTRIFKYKKPQNKMKMSFKILKSITITINE